MDHRRSAGPVPGAAAGHDIVDAEYETIAESGGIERGLPPPCRRQEPPSVAGLDMLKRRQTAERQRGGPMFWVVGAMLVAAAFWVSGGHALLRDTTVLQPSTPAPALRIASVQSHVERHDQQELLFVDGEAVNETGAEQALPALSINVLDNEGRTTRYLLGTNDRLLGPGQRFGFSSRLLAPNSGVKSVSVTFEEE